MDVKKVCNFATKKNAALVFLLMQLDDSLEVNISDSLISFSAWPDKERNMERRRK